MIILLVVIGLSLLILGHEAGHFVAAKWFGLKIDEFGFGFPPRMFARRKGETEYSFNWLPLGGFVRIRGENDKLGEDGTLEALSEEEKKRSFVFQDAWKRSVIVLAGVTVNFLIGWFLLSLVFAVGTPPALLISGVQSNSPAETVGLREGDVLTGFSTAESFVAFANENRGKEVVLTILRDGGEIAVAVTPRISTKEGEGPIGVALAEGGVARMPILSAIGEGLRYTGVFAWMTVVGFASLLGELFLHATLPEGVVGPVGIVSVATQAGGIGIMYLLQLFALISVNLAVINLIPFPALDGGRFFMIIVEKLKGSPLSRKIEAAINGVGFIVLILLMILVTARDIANWVS